MSTPGPIYKYPMFFFTPLPQSHDNLSKQRKVKILQVLAVLPSNHPYFMAWIKS